MDRDTRRKRQGEATDDGGLIVNLVSLTLAVIVFFYGYIPMRHGIWVWKNNYRQTIYAPALLPLALVFLVAGLVPWSYLARRRRKGTPPHAHPRRHPRKF